MTVTIRVMLISLLIVFTVSSLSLAQNPPPPNPARTPPPNKVGSKQPTTEMDADAEVIRVETDLATTLFTAVDRDRHFVTTLGPQDVQIFENDVLQNVSLFQRETDRPLSLAILIDTSVSQEGVLAEEKRAAIAFVESVIRPGVDRAAVLSFTGAPKLEQALTGDRLRLRKGIEQVRIEMSPENERRLAAGDDPLPVDQDPSGYTSIWDAIWFTVREQLSKTPDNSRRAIILLSDGDDTASHLGKQEIIDLAVKSDVVIYSIGIRDANFPEGKLDAGALRKVSDRTGGRAFIPRGPGDLSGAFAQIDQELRSQYIIAYSPTNKSRDASYRRVRIDVINPELRKQKLQLLYRQGYYAKKS